MIINDSNRKQHPIFSKIPEHMWTSAFHNQFDTNTLQVAGLRFAEVRRDLLPHDDRQAIIILAVLFPEESPIDIFQKKYSGSFYSTNYRSEAFYTLYTIAAVGNGERLQELDPEILQSFFKINSSFLIISATCRRLKSNRWQREVMVAIILWASVVAKIKTA